MDYARSSAFSAEPIDELNLIAGNLDCRLYAFAYYSPKCYENIAELDSREKFWVAVTNLYALHHDCSPFHKIPKAIFGSYNNLTTRFIRSFHELLSNLRAMYCHNCSNKDNENVIVDVENAFRRCDRTIDFLSDDDRFREANLLFEENQWEDALNFLCRNSDEVIRLYKARLTNLKSSPEKQLYVESMLEQIASWTTKSYVGLWRFMKGYACSFIPKCTDKNIKENWQNEASKQAIACCVKDLLSFDCEEIDFAAYPCQLLMKVFSCCKCFTQNNKKELRIKPIEYSA